MHKIFIAQKSYCACCVLSLATIRSKYYFNSILNRPRSGRKLFDRPSYVLQLTENYKVYILEDLHPLGGKNVLNMCDLFKDDYKEFVLGELTELWDTYKKPKQPCKKTTHICTN